MSNVDLMTPLISDSAMYYQTRTDEVSENEIYYGFAFPSHEETEEVWLIMKQTISGNITKKTYANHNAKFDKKWTERTTYEYK